MASDLHAGTEHRPEVRTLGLRGRPVARPAVAALVVVVVTALAGGLRFYHLSSPHQYVFDEVYYAKDGCLDAGFPYQQCRLQSPIEQTVTVHPPLGRWLIAGGERWFGNRPFGWRVAAATFGTLSVGLLTLLAYLLFGSPAWAGAAGVLLATENLNFVQSRIAMLDIFVAAFVVAGFTFLLLDRRWIEARTPEPDEAGQGGLDEEGYLLGLPADRPPAPLLRPWRLAAGVAFGAAVASKWSGLLGLAGALLLSVGWERVRRARLGLPAPLWGALRDEGPSLVLALGLVPAAVYLASYAKWLADHHVDFGAWWSLQRGMYSFSFHLHQPHPYQSPAWSWILLKRPVAYYYQCLRTLRGQVCGEPAEILGVGNPAVFWGSVLALPYLAWAWVRRRDPAAGLIAVAVGVQYLPWFTTNRTSFLFYMTPVSPFLALAVAYALRDLARVRLGVERSRALAPAAAFLVVVSAAVFLFFFPVLTGRGLSYAGWKARMWFPSWI